jgi:hypothetical protein
VPAALQSASAYVPAADVRGVPPPERLYVAARGAAATCARHGVLPRTAAIKQGWSGGPLYDGTLRTAAPGNWTCACAAFPSTPARGAEGGESDLFADLSHLLEVFHGHP